MTAPTAPPFFNNSGFSDFHKIDKFIINSTEKTFSDVILFTANINGEKKDILEHHPDSVLSRRRYFISHIWVKNHIEHCISRSS